MNFAEVASTLRRRNLFIRLDLPSTVICHENGVFRKRSSNRRNLKKLAFRFRVDQNYLKTRELTLISLTEFCSNTNKNSVTDDCYVFKFLRRSVDGNHLESFAE